jgi:hypothetical protein
VRVLWQLDFVDAGIGTTMYKYDNLAHRLSPVLTDAELVSLRRKRWDVQKSGN